ncbi:MAG: aminotransferase class I/II-fold pyridoxal phosphate-dependent enzyme [Gemmatimonadota bacterium]
MPKLSSQFLTLPEYPLADVPKLKADLRDQGVDVIDLGAGDADLMPPESTVTALGRAAGQARYSRYPFQLGLREFRAKIADWMGVRFGVELDPFEHILPLIGAKEGIAHLPLVYLDRGEGAIIPDPGYPPYFGGVHMAGGKIISVPLRREKGFLLDWEEVSADDLARAKLLYLNYPNNPTGAVAPDEYFEAAIAFCREHDLLLAHDNAYSEIAFDGYRPPSVLQYEGALDVAVEYHTLSKTFNMTGWRIGWVAGNPQAVASLTRVKTFLDNGLFLACQAAGIATLEAWESFLPANVAEFQARRDAAVEGFAAAGFKVETPRATMYLWIPIPGDEPSIQFSRRILKDSGVVLFPGAAMGAGGEGFFRVALTQSPERMREAARRVLEVV